MNNLKEFFQYIFDAIKIFIIVQPWQAGIRVRKGKSIRVMDPGIYFRIPYLDSVYIQEIRLRTLSCSMQTLTTKDGKTVTIKTSIGYSITSIRVLYETLYHPEMTLANIAMSAIADYIFSSDLGNVTQNEICRIAVEKLNEKDYGIKCEYLKITSFAIVRTYRLIQDGESWNDERLKIDEKK